MEVEVISREIIKPSSPTPPHLRSYKISLLDHLYAPSYIPVFIYYNSTISTNDIEKDLPKLKNALSKTLTRFYPLAGRLEKCHRHIDCNDNGIIFCITHVKNCTMANLMEKEGNIGTQLGLYPLRPWVAPNEDSDYVQVAIQLNWFDHGGIGLGVIFSHKIIDAITIGSFLKCWANISNGCDDTYWPNYSAALIYPLRDSISSDLFRSFFVKELMLKGGDICISRKFLFNGEAINDLKSKAMSKNVPHPSCFEALSCFIWKHAMVASKIVSNGQKRKSALTSHVDLRRKTMPPLQKSTVGNLLWNVCAFCDESDENEELKLNGLVMVLRAELNKIKDEFVPKSQGDKGYNAICEKLKELRDVSSIPYLNAYIITSWIGVGFYEADFGWGKAVNVGFMGAIADFKLKNKIYLIEAGYDSEAIEAYINLDRAEMDVLVNDPEFLAFASPA